MTYIHIDICIYRYILYIYIFKPFIIYIHIGMFVFIVFLCVKWRGYINLIGNVGHSLFNIYILHNLNYLNTCSLMGEVENAFIRNEWKVWAIQKQWIERVD